MRKDEVASQVREPYLRHRDTCGDVLCSQGSGIFILIRAAIYLLAPLSPVGQYFPIKYICREMILGEGVSRGSGTRPCFSLIGLAPQATKGVVTHLCKSLSHPIQSSPVLSLCRRGLDTRHLVPTRKPTATFQLPNPQASHRRWSLSPTLLTFPGLALPSLGVPQACEARLSFYRRF